MPLVSLKPAELVALHLYTPESAFSRPVICSVAELSLNIARNLGPGVISWSSLNQAIVMGWDPDTLQSKEASLPMLPSTLRRDLVNVGGIIRSDY